MGGGALGADVAEADEDNYKQLEMNCLEMATLETMQTKLKFQLAQVCECVRVFASVCA